MEAAYSKLFAFCSQVYKHYLAMSKTNPHRFRDSTFYIDIRQSQFERVKTATPSAEKGS